MPGNRLDGWLRTDAVEWLEAHGAVGIGMGIIEELNGVYRRTGIAQRIVDQLIVDATRIHAMTHASVRILQYGMRDGMLLRMLHEESELQGLPLDLHGSEFHPSLVDLARTRCKEMIPAAHLHLDSERDFAWAGSERFDLVFSLFMLHHLDADQLTRALATSDRLASHGLLHFDLARSLHAALLTWLYYSMTGRRKGRHDAVLSCRRAYRAGEIRSLLQRGTGAENGLSVRSRFPMYLLVRRSPGD